MHFEVGCKIKEQQFVYSTSNFYWVFSWGVFIKFCPVVWQVLLLELPEETATFSLHISQYTGVMIFLFIFFSATEETAKFQSYYKYKAFMLWLLSATDGWVWEKAVQHLNQVPVMDELQWTVEFKHWFSFPKKLGDVTHCHFQWFNVKQTFLGLWDKITLHYSDSYMYCNNWTWSSSSMLHDI